MATASGEETLLDGKYSIDFDQTLGSGSMGIVYYGTVTDQPNKEIALKVITVDTTQLTEEENEKQMKTMEREQIPEVLHHANIADILDYHVQTTQHHLQRYIFMDLYHTNLSNYILAQHDLSVNAKLELTRQCCSGVQHLHKTRIIHRNIKPSNILIQRSAGSVFVKLADYGYSKDMFYSTNPTAGVGTQDWMAPELFARENYDYAVDVFSLGHVFLAMFSCQPGRSNYLYVFTEVGKTILENPDFKVTENLPPTCRWDGPERFKEMVGYMMMRYPQSRPKITEVMQTASELVAESMEESVRGQAIPVVTEDTANTSH